MRARPVCYCCGMPTDSPKRIQPGETTTLDLCHICAERQAPRAHQVMTNDNTPTGPVFPVKSLAAIQRTTASAAHLLARQSHERARVEHFEGVGR